jgi:hypothetical protein
MSLVIDDNQRGRSLKLRRVDPQGDTALRLRDAAEAKMRIHNSDIGDLLGRKGKQTRDIDGDKQAGEETTANNDSDQPSL